MKGRTESATEFEGSWRGEEREREKGSETMPEKKVEVVAHPTWLFKNPLYNDCCRWFWALDQLCSFYFKALSLLDV